MNIKVRYRKEYLDIFNAGTGETGKSSDYQIVGVIEFYDKSWNPTAVDLASGTNIAQVIAKFEMFPKQWIEFSNMLIQGAKASSVELEVKYDDE